MPHIRGNAMKRKSQSIPSIPRSRICFAETRKPLSQPRKSRVRQENAEDRKTVSAPRREFLTRDLSSLSARWEKRKKYIRSFSRRIPIEVVLVYLFPPISVYTLCSVVGILSLFATRFLSLPECPFLLSLPRCDKSVAFQR